MSSKVVSDPPVTKYNIDSFSDPINKTKDRINSFSDPVNQQPSD